MKGGYVGTIVSTIVMVLLLYITPMYYIGIIEWARSEAEVRSITRDLVDEVIDTRVLTDDMMADFNLSLAAESSVYRAVITREIKVINPDPVYVGETYTSYIVSDDISVWDQGDAVTVRIETIGPNIFQTIARRMLQLDVIGSDFQYCGRVR